MTDLWSWVGCCNTACHSLPNSLQNAFRSEGLQEAINAVAVRASTLHNGKDDRSLVMGWLLQHCLPLVAKQPSECIQIGRPPGSHKCCSCSCLHSPQR